MASLEDFCILADSRHCVNYFLALFYELGVFFERYPVVGRFTKHHDVIWFGTGAQQFVCDAHLAHDVAQTYDAMNIAVVGSGGKLLDLGAGDDIDPFFVAHAPRCVMLALTQADRR